MTQFFDQLSNGIILGALYGLIALGYTMVYGIIQLINFAHGEIFMVGAFGGLATYQYALPDSIASSAWLALPLVLVGAVMTAVIVAVATERLAYRPLRNAPRLAPLITAIGVSIVLQEVVRLWYPQAKSNRPFPEFITGQAFEVGGVKITRVELLVVVTAVALMLALQAFVRKSKTGRAMRATSQDADTARLMGINIDRIIVLTFAIGAVLAAVAGVLQGMRNGQVGFSMGFIAGIKAFTAAVLGGIGNITGAVAGGFILGIAEALATQYLYGGGAYKDVWAFVVLILVLVFRPSGLFGERIGGRA